MMPIKEEIAVPSIAKKSLDYAWRFTAFVALAGLCLSAVLAIDLVAIRLALEWALGAETLGQYKPGVSLAAMLIFALSTKVIFRKIIRRQPIKYDVIALLLFVLLQTVGLTLTLGGLGSYSPAFTWLSFLGLGFYYFVIKPFKKDSVE